MLIFVTVYHDACIENLLLRLILFTFRIKLKAPPSVKWVILLWAPPILAAILCNAPPSGFRAPPPDNYCTVPKLYKHFHKWFDIFYCDNFCFGCLVRVSQNLKFLYCASIFIGNLPVSALHALLLQYLFTPSSHFKNLIWTSFHFRREVWGISEHRIA